MKVQKNLVLILVMGIVYCFVETVFRALTFQCHPLYPNYWSLYGSVSLWMLPIGGVIGLTIGHLNEWFWSKNFPLWVQSLISMVMIFAVEYISGLVLNIWLGLNIWSYAGLPGNIQGQIWLVFAPLWYLLSPFAMWLDDKLEGDLGNTTRISYSISDIYRSLFAGR